MTKDYLTSWAVSIILSAFPLRYLRISITFTGIINISYKKRPRLRSTAAGAFAVVNCTRYNNTAAASL